MNGDENRAVKSYKICRFCFFVKKRLSESKGVAFVSLCETIGYARWILGRDYLNTKMV